MIFFKFSMGTLLKYKPAQPSLSSTNESKKVHEVNVAEGNVASHVKVFFPESLSQI